ncbi:TRAP transporter substrate-binding protein [Alteribacillus iranensis]|uniref:Tripartite ATP-independent transporter solute receptor, DctP family n=1 Tax=Alteribacillus iranensis TaxID=930128 RepID=A0A1I2DPR8_9BACI|nr:TRAP transporter substrate-binding protein [Alteribacillus iranensis]SFE82468.1 tripartite ATP-independent transporter solute receptor, DctP family [Alteribacillus iranensis]
MKQIFVSLFFLLTLTLLAACGGGQEESSAGEAKNDNEKENISESNDDPITIKVGHIAGPDEAYSIGMEQYAEAVEEATDGRVEFEIFGNGQLGGERDVTEQIQLGSLDMSVVTTGVVGNFVEDITVFEMPFLFRDLEHAYAVLDSDLAQEILDGMEEEGLKGISFWENGNRHLANNERPITSPEDLEGLKIRTVENDMFLDAYRMLGADPVPMAFPEVYSSLQQGVIDGTDQPYPIFWGKNIYEVQDYLSEVGFYYASATLLMNLDFYESLPEDIQEIIVDVGKEYAQIQRDINQDLVEQAKEAVQEDGVEITEADDVDIEAFREKIQPLHEQYEEQFGDYLKRIKEM